jgi:small GTP-binding protein
MGSLLDSQTRQLTQQVQHLLTRGLEVLLPSGLDTAPLRQAVQDLDGPFLLVVVGEFNSGKSSLLNALLNTRLLAEGVTPTTDRIHLIGYAPQPSMVPVDPQLAEVGLPIELLRELRLVDTPGTNAIFAHHQTLTERFLPRADLILFATSADRPFTQSEANFLGLIRNWGKKVLLVVNKIDLLTPAEQQEVLNFVQQGGQQVLGQQVKVFGVSARQGEGLPQLLEHVAQLLAHEARPLKLGSPLGVLHHLVSQAQPLLQQQLEQQVARLASCQQLETLLQRHHDRTQRDFAGQVALASQVLDEVRERGERWLDQTVRFSRLPALLSTQRFQQGFAQEVAQNSNAALERAVQQALHWLTQRHAELLEDALTLLRQTPTTTGAAQPSPTHPIESLLEEALKAYHPTREAEQLQSQLQQALQNSLLAGLGGVGLGAGLVVILQGLAADLTGLVAGLVAALLGLSILPRRKDLAKQRLRGRLAQVRQGLEEALEWALDQEQRRTTQRFQSLYRPACQSLQATHDQLLGQQAQQQELLQTIQQLRKQLALPMQ